MKRYYLENCEDGSTKFWEVTWTDAELATRWGKIGSAGQRKTQAVESLPAAQSLAESLAAAKRKRGYKDALYPSTSTTKSTAKSVGPEAASDDFTRLKKVFAAINQGELIALSNVGQTQSHALEIIAEEAHRRKVQDYSAVFWQKQSQDAFGKDRNLAGDLLLHWTGDRKRIAKVLSEHLSDFVLNIPSNDLGAFVVSSKRPVVSDIDPLNPVAAQRLLEAIRTGKTSASENAPTLRQILKSGDPKLAIFAFQMLQTDAIVPEDVDIALSRADEFVELRPGPQVWQDPSYTFGWILDAMLQVKHPNYATQLEQWSSSKRKTFRLGSARHAGQTPDHLQKLATDSDSLVRQIAELTLKYR